MVGPPERRKGYCSDRRSTTVVHAGSAEHQASRWPQTSIVEQFDVGNSEPNTLRDVRPRFFITPPRHRREAISDPACAIAGVPAAECGFIVPPTGPETLEIAPRPEQDGKPGPLRARSRQSRHVPADGRRTRAASQRRAGSQATRNAARMIQLVLARQRKAGLLALELPQLLPHPFVPRRQYVDLGPGAGVAGVEAETGEKLLLAVAILLPLRPRAITRTAILPTAIGRCHKAS